MTDFFDDDLPIGQTSTQPDADTPQEIGMADGAVPNAPGADGSVLTPQPIIIDLDAVISTDFSGTADDDGDYTRERDDFPTESWNTDIGEPIQPPPPKPSNQAHATALVRTALDQDKPFNMTTIQFASKERI